VGDVHTAAVDCGKAARAAEKASHKADSKANRDNIRDQASKFFWMWLLFATVVSIGGNVIHAWMTAPDTDLRLLTAAAVPPAVLLGATHSVALLIKRASPAWRVNF
jgi:hypothetical protein